jgi:O-antigen biosynthesis protein
MLPGWSAVIVNYNGAGYIEACLAALSAAQNRPHDIIVVDNASTDDSLQELHGFPRTQVLAQPRNLGFAAGANIGLAAVETEIALLLNPDVEIDADFGAALVAAFASDSRLGAVGGLLLYPDGRTIQHAGGAIDRPLMTTRHLGYGSTDLDAYARSMDAEFVTGGALGLRMEAVQAVDGFDERFSPVYYEDVDLCIRLREAGWAVRFDPRLRALHHEGVTLQRSAAYYRHLHSNRLRFALKYLTSEEWSAGFVPAEFARLRHELATLTNVDWPERSGAAALEAVLRGSDSADDWLASSLLVGPAPSALAAHVDVLRAGWDVRGEPLRSGIPLVARLRNWVNNLGPRWYVDDALARQREFNAAVVRAVDAQDQLNREQVAALFLLAIDALGRLRFSADDRESDDPRQL